MTFTFLLTTLIEEDATARLQLILVNEAQDGNVVFAAHAGGHNGVVVVDDFLQVTHTHRCSSQIINFAALLFIFLLLGLQSLLIPDKLLLHEQIVLDPLLLEQPQPALGVGSHAGQLVSGIGSLDTLALLANPSNYNNMNYNCNPENLYSNPPGWHGRLVLLLLLLRPLVLPCAPSRPRLLVTHLSI